MAKAARYTPIVAVDDERGNRYFLDPSDAQVGRSLFTVGSFDLEKMDLAVHELAGRTITQILDIGANIGTTVIELLSRFPNATGVAFEPDEKNFQLLTLNVTANDLGRRVVLHRLALSDVDGEVLLELSEDNLGDHRIRVGPPSLGVYGEHERITKTVRARRLDALIEDGELEVGTDTLVYMDAQGHEGHILAGATRLLTAGCPIVFEFWPYGLLRSGGYEHLVQAIAGCSRIVNLHEPDVPTEWSDIESLSRRLGETGHADLLLIP